MPRWPHPLYDGQLLVVEHWSNAVTQAETAAHNGHQGRIVAAVAVNAARSLPAYQALIEARAPFPPELHASDGPAELRPLPAGFPQRGQPTHDLGAMPTGSGPNTPEQRIEGEALKLLDPRVPLGAPLLVMLHPDGMNMWGIAAHRRP